MMVKILNTKRPKCSFEIKNHSVLRAYPSSLFNKTKICLFCIIAKVSLNWFLLFVKNSKLFHNW